MKKLLSLIMLALLAIAPLAARDRISRNVKDLPPAAQTLLNKYFGGEKVNHIKIDKPTFGSTEYDVILNNGTEIEFDSKGDWKEIDCGNSSVPKDLVLKSIRDYVSSNFKGQKIVNIEKTRNKYNIELQNGTDLEFDRSGRFLRIDD